MRRAFAEFLYIPTVVIILFVLLSVLTYFVDQWSNAAENGEGGLFGTKLFSDYEASRSLLGTIAGGIITVSSISFSLLLIAVQQGAATLTAVVFDQFLRRWTNQFYFGFFLGLALFCLINLATTTPVHNPVYGVTIAFIMTVAALYMLVLLIYTTVDQARPTVIVEAIHDHTLRARARRAPLLARTRGNPALAHRRVVGVNAWGNGFLSDIGLDALAQTAREAGCGVEFVILIPLGDYVAYGDRVAEVRLDGEADDEVLQKAVLAALPLESQRDLDTDPVLGIEQLSDIGWTSVSTAKSHPQPGLLVCWALRDILVRHLEPEAPDDSTAESEPVPVVYRDNFIGRLMDALESLTIVASESMQHQTAATLHRSLTTLYPRLTPQLRDRTDELLMRSLPAMGEHVLSRELDAALGDLVEVLDEAGNADVARAVGEARRRLDRTVGQLDARGTRASSTAPGTEK